MTTSPQSLYMGGPGTRYRSSVQVLTIKTGPPVCYRSKIYEDWCGLPVLYCRSSPSLSICVRLRACARASEGEKRRGGGGVFPSLSSISPHPPQSVVTPSEWEECKHCGTAVEKALSVIINARIRSPLPPSLQKQHAAKVCVAATAAEPVWPKAPARQSDFRGL